MCVVAATVGSSRAGEPAAVVRGDAATYGRRPRDPNQAVRRRPAGVHRHLGPNCCFSHAGDGRRRHAVVGTWSTSDVPGSFAAQKAFQIVVGLDDEELMMTAQLCLGRLHEENGETAEARSAYEQASTSRNPDIAVHARYSLGAFCADMRDFPGARAAYQQVVETHHPEYAARAEQALKDLQE